MLVKNKNLKTETFIDLLENNARIQHIETAELKVIVEEFPYFQAARALYLKELKSQDSFKYNNELKITAAYTTDRTILFNYITSFNADTKNILKENTQLSITTNEVKAPLEIGKPLAFSSTENHSFNQWLQLSPKKVIIRNEEKQVQQKAKKEDLIDKFIQNSPKIAPLEKGIKFTVPVSKNKYDAALMTETLAKVYLEQKKYENAMQAYKILSLKYPEKSGFFADQIKRIQILQKNK
ncbi:MAG: hypothetical protein ACJA17_000420 [Polaribacter sp.]